jgi:hypothetical protein
MGRKYKIKDRTLCQRFPLGVIYKAINILNNKSYIGQTTETVNNRRLQHIKESKISDYKFNRALRKYKDKYWKWSIIHIVQENENINKLEIKYIKLYDSYNKGYNSTLGGQYLNREELEKEISIKDLNDAREKRKLNCKKIFVKKEILVIKLLDINCIRMKVIKDIQLKQKNIINQVLDN